MLALPWSLGAALPALLLVGCKPDSSTTQERTTQEQAPTLEVRTVDPSASPLASAEERVMALGLEILDVAQDGRVIAGRRGPVPERASVPLLFEARFIDQRGDEHSLPWSRRVQDARFAPAPSRLVALLDEHDALFLWSGPGTEARRVDDGVFPGFAFSGSGQMLAYSKGQAPRLDAYCYDLASEQSRRLTQVEAPVWSFAFSPDDSRIVYVDSRDGFPALMTMAPDGSRSEQLTNRGITRADVRAGVPLAPFPDSRRPPLWSNRAIYVEDSHGVHAFDGQGRLLLSRPGARDLHRGKAAATILFRENRTYWSAP
jgi:hypothetical protein